MPKSVRVLYGPMGQVKYELKGYSGSECTERLQPEALADLLGSEPEVEATPDNFNDPHQERLPEDFGS